jgi:subtilisin family serine protease
VNGLAVELPTVSPEEAEARLRADSSLAFRDDPIVKADGAGSDGAGSDGVFVTPASAPRTEFYPWGIEWIGTAEVQDDYPGLVGGGVKVALIDTGVDKNHPDLRHNIIGGYNAIAGQDPDNWQDDNGHGTHVAGVLAGELNRKGVIGMAPGVRIYVIKGLDSQGKGFTSDIINGLQHLPRDIRVISGSFGTDLIWPDFEAAIARLRAAGKLMVFSAGNRCTPQNAAAQGAGSDGAGSDAAPVCTVTPAPTDTKYPAKYPGVIAVGSSDGNDQVATFSRSGKAIADHGVVAPGVNIFSTNLGGGYGVMSGTSASVPHVTGAIVLALQLQPDLAYDELLTLLRRTSRNTGYDAEEQGAGRINVEKLVKRLIRQQHD